jgi:hypothetical protein
MPVPSTACPYRIRLLVLKSTSRTLQNRVRRASLFLRNRHENVRFGEPHGTGGVHLHRILRHENGVNCFEQSRKRRLVRFATTEQISHRQSVIVCRDGLRTALVDLLQPAEPRSTGTAGLAHLSETPLHPLAAMPLYLIAIRTLCATTIAEHRLASRKSASVHSPFAAQMQTPTWSIPEEIGHESSSMNCDPEPTSPPYRKSAHSSRSQRTGSAERSSQESSEVPPEEPRCC